jgi:hypothetical protein
LVLPRERTFFLVHAAIDKIGTEIVSSYESLLMEDGPFKRLSKRYDHSELTEGLESCLVYYNKIPDIQLHLQFKLAENKIDKLLKIISDTKRQNTNTISVTHPNFNNR